MITMAQSISRNLGTYGSTSLTGKKLSELTTVITREALIRMNYKAVNILASVMNVFNHRILQYCNIFHVC